MSLKAKKIDANIILSMHISILVINVINWQLIEGLWHKISFNNNGSKS